MSDAFELELGPARVLFSTRRGGVSKRPYDSLNLGVLTDDEPEQVIENRRLLAERAGLAPERVAMGWQVHGIDVREWEAPPEPPLLTRLGAELAHVDAHVTSEPGLALLVLVADCLPIALAAPGRVAMAHCGWRGLAEGILERVVARFDEPPAAALGPAIGPCCYEVGPEVLERFAQLDGVTRGRMLDLRAIAARQLRAAGVERVEHVELCTSCRADLFFSHRRDAGVTGRQGGLAWLV